MRWSALGERIRSARPRVALFSGNYNYIRDGANQALNRLVGFLEAEGAEVRIYSPTTATPAFEPTGTLVPVPSFGIPGRSEYRLALGLTPSIRRDLEAFAPDLVHVSAPDLLGIQAQGWAIRNQVPLVASLHTRFETYLDYYGWGWFRPTGERFLDWFYRRNDLVLVPNRAIREEMSVLEPGTRVREWGRGVDREIFSPSHRDIEWRRALGYADDEAIVLFFGRLVVEKGVGVFAETVRRLREQGCPVRPLVVGEGPARAAFEEMGDVVLTGHLAGEDLSRAIASADILLTPSTTEAFGNVVLEAMASGLAVVSADAPSARALINDGVTGRLCPPEDADAYAAAIRRLIEVPMDRARMGHAACKASLDFSWQATLRAVLEGYGELCPALMPAPEAEPIIEPQGLRRTGS
jgi:glycosyltransferase involved in cell wall biosynthesis